MSLPIYVQKYLNKFSTDKWKLETATSNNYNTIVVIPALEEYEGIIRLLESVILNDSEFIKKTLFIFVVNNVISAPQNIRQDNEKSLRLLRNILNKKNSSPFTEKIYKSGINIGIVDAASSGNELPDKEGGVGLARKTGMDIALQRFDYSNKNILVCLDADCIIENNYLETLHKIPEDINAGYIQYRHILPDEEEARLAIICYEIFLRYYVLGLAVAESPYAFHTIGSTLFCDVESYTKIQGMNKRKAAEDFYFIEKLSKITMIHEIKETIIYPSARPSWRVPFGTGQRVNRFLNKEQDEYTLYSFKSFLVLKQWLKIFMSDETDPDLLLDEANKISVNLYQFLIEQNFPESWGKILKHTSDAAQLQKQKIFWFDGFKTLKLIHYLRDKEFPNEFMFDVLDEALDYLQLKKNELRKKNGIPLVTIQMNYLELLRNYF